jgi:hypothetical protein
MEFTERPKVSEPFTMFLSRSARLMNLCLVEFLYPFASPIVSPLDWFLYEHEFHSDGIIHSSPRKEAHRKKVVRLHLQGVLDTR